MENDDMIEYCQELAEEFHEEQKEWQSMTEEQLISWVNWFTYLRRNRNKQRD